MVAKKLRWRSVYWLGLSSLLVVVAVEIGLRWLIPTIHLREVEDALEEYQSSDPTVLVVGSSHARTFEVTGQEVWRRTQGRQRILSVPVEYGKFHSYHWVIQHRLRPLIEEVDAQGHRKRRSLQQVILVTEWWDSTPTEGGGPAHNLPSRAWFWHDFVRDVWQHGLTTYNRNYLRHRWERIFSFSMLIQDRGHHRILSSLRNTLRPVPSDVKHRDYQEKVRVWQRMVLHGAKQMVHPQQMDALSQFVDYFLKQNIKVTILLYPRMPVTITPESQSRTLDAFAAIMRKFCAQKNITLLDTSYQSPLSDQHFASDFDHITPEGNKHWTQWALQGPLRFLLQIPSPVPLKFSFPSTSQRSAPTVR